MVLPPRSTTFRKRPCETFQLYSRLWTALLRRLVPVGLVKVSITDNVCLQRTATEIHKSVLFHSGPYVSSTWTGHSRIETWQPNTVWWHDLLNVRDAGTNEVGNTSIAWNWQKQRVVVMTLQKRQLPTYLVCSHLSRRRLCFPRRVVSLPIGCGRTYHGEI